jgi:hypothetical protein
VSVTSCAARGRRARAASRAAKNGFFMVKPPRRLWIGEEGRRSRSLYPAPKRIFTTDGERKPRIQERSQERSRGRQHHSLTVPGTSALPRANRRAMDSAAAGFYCKALTARKDNVVYFVISAAVHALLV